DMKTGKSLWHEAGPSECMCLSGNLLLATSCGIDPWVTQHGRCVIARTVSTGAEAFRVGLPQKEYEEVLPMLEIAGIFLVQQHESLDAAALMIDRKGGIRHRLNRTVLTGKRIGQELVLLTSADVVCLSSDDKTHWKTPFARDEFVAGGDLVFLK